MDQFNIGLSKTKPNCNSVKGKKDFARTRANYTSPNYAVIPKELYPLNLSGLSTSLRSSLARMANSSSVATLETIWVINVDSVIMEIPHVIIEEIRAHPTHTMGWFSPKLRKAWKLLFPLTPTSSALGYLHLTNPTWGRMIDPWWKFLSDTQGPKEVRKLV